MKILRLLSVSVVLWEVSSFSLSRIGLQAPSTLLFSTKQKDRAESGVAEKDLVNGATNEESGVAASKVPPSDGLPWWWELIWDLDIMKTGTPGEDIIFGDTANVLRTNIEQIYGGYPSLDGCPIAEGEITDIAEGTMFIGLQTYYNRYGSPYKLCFGPKSFLVISDPVQAKHVLRDANTLYDKGMLGELLEPIMGKGLIPADPATWSVRRRQIVPGFHKAWLDHMVRRSRLHALFSTSTDKASLSLLSFRWGYLAIVIVL